MLAVPVVVLAERAWAQRWMSDDGFIALRVVKELVAGHGPVFDPGERVEAATSPLWVAILALAHVITRFPLEWIAVTLGIALTLGGLALAIAASRAVVAATYSSPTMLVPLGALVYAVLPPAWEFATSGLETGLSIAWIGGCFFTLASLGRGEGRASERRACSAGAALVGLGPLVRPDLVVFSATFLVALVMGPARARTGSRTRTVVAAAALPSAYELFRMAYYGALVPNPAFTKEAAVAWWRQGWYYLADLVNRYWLWIPVGVLVAGALVPLLSQLHRRSRPLHSVVIAVVGGGLLHALYVVRVGGDFMHGRLLLPSVFALLAPVAVVPGRASRWVTLVVVPWAAVCLLALRPPVHGSHGIGDERRAYLARARPHAHPVEVGDYQPPQDRLLVPGVLSFETGAAVTAGGSPVRLAPHAPRKVLAAFSPGIPSFAVDADTYVLDVRGIGDGLTARFELGRRGRPGHDKILLEPWLAARFLHPGERLPIRLALLLAASVGQPAEPFVPDAVEAARVAAARRVLGCGDVAELRRVGHDPLTPGRAARNLLDALTLYRLRIPTDPSRAARRLCGR